MTVTQILDTARDLYNATSDSFFTDAQMYYWLQQASNMLAREAYVIQASSTATTVAGTQSYAYPANAFAIKRLLYNGKKIKRVDFRSDDAMTLANTNTTQQGTPVYYYDWNGYVYFRPIPDSAVTITWFTYNLQPAITASTTLSIPVEYHMDTVEFLLWFMFAKDKDSTSAQLHKGQWDLAIHKAISYEKRKKRTDGFATVLDEDNLPTTVLGES